MTETFILVIVIVTALAFDFTNGFHDTGNAMATSIATGALKPKTAVTISAILNLVGAFLSVEVAKTVGKGIVNLHEFDLSDATESHKLLLVVFAGLIGGIVWNLLTWLLGIPSSSSHALFGGLIGAAFASLGVGGVAWSNILGKIIIPALAAPFVAGLVSACGTWAIYRLTSNVDDAHKRRNFKIGQIATASLVSLAHGTGDAQKTMGVIFLALVAYGQIDQSAHMPLWIIAACAFAIALGTYTGGWRVIRTLGKGLVEIDSPQGMAAEAASAAIILTSSHAGMALSTTHVATGSILGTGLGRKGAEVRWGVAGRMATAWIITLPCAAFVGGMTWLVAHLVGLATTDVVGVIVAFGILVVLAGYMYMHSRKNRVDSDNVNAEWDESTNSVVPASAGASAGVTAAGADARGAGRGSRTTPSDNGTSRAATSAPGDSLSAADAEREAIDREAERLLTSAGVGTAASATSPSPASRRVMDPAANFDRMTAVDPRDPRA